MGVIWRNTLIASNHSDAEKVLAYAKEHYKERGLEDYDEQTMGGLEFEEDGLTYTEVNEDKLNAFYEFADEIAATMPEVELNLRQVGDGYITAEFVYRNGVCTRFEPRMLEFIAADENDGAKLIETAVPLIEAAGFSAIVESAQHSVSFECEDQACAEVKDSLAEQIAAQMPDAKLLCLMHDLDEPEFTVTEYCVLEGHKGEWKSSDEAMYYLAFTFRFSMYDVVLNPVKCFQELQAELRAGIDADAYTAQTMLFADAHYHVQLMDLLTPEDKNWLESSIWIEAPNAEEEKILNEIYTKCSEV